VRNGVAKSDEEKVTLPKDPQSKMATVPERSDTVTFEPGAALPRAIPTERSTPFVIVAYPATTAVFALPSGHVVKTVVCRFKSDDPLGRCPCLKA
jgi:hypothetical protein